MPSEKLYREFQNLERKIQIVLSENSRLKEDLTQAMNENGILKEELQSQKSNLSSFQNQMKVNKLANSMVVGEGDSGELKERLDVYIKEIDKCIAHLAE